MDNRPTRDWGYTIWPGLCGAWLAGFAVAEAIAVRADATTHPSRMTLSRALARWLGVHPRRRHCRAAETAVILGIVGLIVHLESLEPIVVSLVESDD